MKPLARWTIGDVNHTGLEILRESIRLFRRLYPEFEYLLCYNGIDPKKIESIGVEMFEQRADMFDHPLSPHEPDNYGEATGCGWKLCPPRLRPDACELWIDNDLVIRSRIPQIDRWLEEQNHGIVTEGLHRQRMFGLFDSFVPAHVHACAGLFGLPPGFDFAGVIRRYLHVLRHDNKPLGGFDEQGLTVAVVTNMPRYEIIPLSVVHITEDQAPFPTEWKSAYHFVGANRKHWHLGWQCYKARSAVRLLM